MAGKLPRADSTQIWRSFTVSSHRGRFGVVEFWLENGLMIEFMTPEMQAQYKALVSGARNREETTPAA